MKLFEKIKSFKYERRKRKKEKDLKEYNYRQEEMDTKYRNKKQKSDFKILLSRLKFETYTKRLVGIIIFIGIFDLQLSYVLAFLGKEQIAESLSIQVCLTILGTALVYMIRAYFDTKAEKRDEMIKSGIIVGKRSPIIPNEVIENKIRDIINNTGIGEYINNVPHTTPLETENPDDNDTNG